jgi:hypothetical protein
MEETAKVQGDKTEDRTMKNSKWFLMGLFILPVMASNPTLSWARHGGDDGSGGSGSGSGSEEESDDDIRNEDRAEDRQEDREEDRREDRREDRHGDHERGEAHDATDDRVTGADREEHRARRERLESKLERLETGLEDARKSGDDAKADRLEKEIKDVKDKLAGMDDGAKKTQNESETKDSTRTKNRK